MNDELRKRHLALARRHVAEAEERVKDQYRIVESLEASGADATTARMLLGSLENSMEALREHLTVLEHKEYWAGACELYYQETALPSR